ncbi:hypothetical protein pb186bvf_020668 [Paramecium bursaria]
MIMPSSQSKSTLKAFISLSLEYHMRSTILNQTYLKF